jgi:hypothetical protein
MALFGVVIFASCRFEAEVPNVPPRKVGIPEDAFWIGGPNGGNWYQVDYIHNHKNNAFIKVFDDAGRLVVANQFYVICLIKKNRGILIEDLKSQIVAFDGEKIHLKQEDGRDSCWLQYFER